MKILKYFVVLLGFSLITSCASDQIVVNEEPNFTRTAYIDGDQVTIISTTTLSYEEYEKILAQTKANREKLD